MRGRSPTGPARTQIGVLDAFPHLAVNLHRASAELLDRLFDLTQLTARIHYQRNQATLKVVLPADDTPVVATLGTAVGKRRRNRPTAAANPQVRACVASCTCPRWDSNPHWNPYKGSRSPEFAHIVSCGNAATHGSGRGTSARIRRAARLWAGQAIRRTISAMTFERITVDPDLMGGVPTVRGLRIPVATVVSMVADGMTTDEICADLPDLTPEDVAEALRYAAETVRERQLPLRPSA
jgi:Uncharacterized conserved protein